MKDFDSNILCNLATKFLLGFLGTSITSINPCFAQSNIVPDNTLGTEESKVVPNVNVNGGENELIEGGAERGQNLFHSLREFNVDEGRGAYFVVPNDNIQNVLTRVTGNNPSAINGILGTISNRNFDPTNANLFLINPNGIVFGENASLDVNGSFVGTTANEIEFGERGLFSATNPQAASELLTINPSAFLFSQIKQTASIQNNSITPLQQSPSGEDASGLWVPDGKSLLLLGGNVSMDGAGLNAYGGRVELGGLTEPGTVALDINGDNFRLGFPDNVKRGDVSLSNEARVNVEADGGGDIAVNAQNLKMTRESFLFVGIGTGLGSDNSKVGNIDVNATGIVNLNNSYIVNSVQPEARGQGGDVNISAKTLQVENGGLVSAGTYGKGKGGNLTVNAQDVQLIGESEDGISGLFASAQANSTGDASNLTLSTNKLLVQDGAQVFTGTFGEGNGGDLTVNAQDVQLISGEGGTTGLLASAQLNSTGDAGNLTLFTNKLLVKDGAVVTTSTDGKGKGGDLTVNAQDVQLIGESEDISSGLFASAQPNSTGDAGNLTLSTNKLLVQDGAQVFNSTLGEGNGGDLTVNAQEVQLIGEESGLLASAQPNSTGDAGNLTLSTNKLLVRDGAVVFTGAFGEGNGGDLTVNAQEVQLIGRENGLLTSTQPNSTGDAGNLTLSTDKLLVKDGAVVTTSTLGEGNGGDLTVNALDVQLIGKSEDGSFASGLFASTDSNSTGNAGNLNLSTNKLLIQDGAQVFTGTNGKGKGGNLIVNAQDVQIIGEESGLFASAQPNSTGDTGNLTLSTNKLLVKDGSVVSASTLGEGNGGDLTVNAQDVQLIRGEGSTTGLFTSAYPNSTGDAGSLTLSTNKLVVKDGAVVATSTFAEGKGGDLTIDAQDVQLIGTTSLFASVETNLTGDANNLTLYIIDIEFVQDRAFLQSSTSPSGLFASAEPNSTGDAGNLTLSTNKLLVQDGAQVSTGTDGKGKGGDLTIKAQDVQLIGTTEDGLAPSGLFASVQLSSTADAGNLTLSTNKLLVQDGAAVFTGTLGKGKGGDLIINANTLQLKDNGIITAQSANLGLGIAGNIEIDVKDNFNADNGQVVTSSEQTNGGNINITGKNIMLRNDSNIRTTLSTTAGSGGNITLTANAIVALEDSDILAFAPEGTGGNINFDTDAFLSDSLYSPRRQTTENLTKEELDALDGNNRVDVDATGSISSGIISGQTDPSFLQNSLTELPQNQIDSETLIASSCVVRSKQRNGTFFITGKSNFPYRPGDAVASSYSAVEVQPLPDNTSSKPRRRWKIGYPIVEPSGVYRLANGRSILSRECGK